MALQTVFRLTHRNGFDGLQPFQEPIPTAESHEILIKIRSVALNFRDIAIATSQYPLPVKDQVIPCGDMSGEVVEIGAYVKDFAVGDRVVAPVNPEFLYGDFKNSDGAFSGGERDGVLREYISLPAHALVKLPKSGGTFASWAAMTGTGVTTWNAFYGNKQLRPGDVVLLEGTGGFAITALLFAKAAGAITIITSSSDEKLERIKQEFGVDHTVNYKTHPDWAAEVVRITNGRGADHVLDVGGDGTIEQSMAAVASGGIVTLVGFLSQVPADKRPAVAIPALSRNITLRGVNGGSKQQLEEAVRFLGKKGLVMPVDKTFAFNRTDIIAAMTYIVSGQHIGKVCINLD